MSTRWHYTTPARFTAALAQGALTPSAHGPGELGLLWFCESELPPTLGGPLRIGVAPETAPLAWPDAIALIRTHKVMRASMKK
jgi:hypothetical protein